MQRIEQSDTKNSVIKSQQTVSNEASVIQNISVQQVNKSDSVHLKDKLKVTSSPKLVLATKKNTSNCETKSDVNFEANFKSQTRSYNKKNAFKSETKSDVNFEANFAQISWNRQIETDNWFEVNYFHRKTASDYCKTDNKSDLAAKKDCQFSCNRQIESDNNFFES